MKPHRAFFLDAERDFALNRTELQELQRKLGTGIGAIFQRVGRFDFYVEDLTETLRLALIGGGTDAQEAAELVDAFIAIEPLEKAMTIAVDILQRCMIGETAEVAA